MISRSRQPTTRNRQCLTLTVPHHQYHVPHLCPYTIPLPNTPTARNEPCLHGKQALPCPLTHSHVFQCNAIQARGTDFGTSQCSTTQYQMRHQKNPTVEMWEIRLVPRTCLAASHLKRLLRFVSNPSHRIGRFQELSQDSFCTSCCRMWNYATPTSFGKKQLTSSHSCIDSQFHIPRSKIQHSNQENTPTRKPHTHNPKPRDLINEIPTYITRRWGSVIAMLCQCYEQSQRRERPCLNPSPHH